MKVVFASCFLSHHQKPFSEVMYKLLGDDYCFIAEEPMSDERKELGWTEGTKEKYVINALASEDEYKRCIDIINDADVLIVEGRRYNLYEQRIKQNKLTFNYSERIYKEKYQFYKFPIRILRHHLMYVRYKSLYLLCASAFAASDYAKSFAFINRAYKWGYFPECKEYDIDDLIEKKEENSLLWAGRFIKYKHPEKAIETARRLKEQGIDYKLRFIGTSMRAHT